MLWLSSILSSPETEFDENRCSIIQYDSWFSTEWFECWIRFTVNFWFILIQSSKWFDSMSQCLVWLTMWSVSSFRRQLSLRIGSFLRLLGLVCSVFTRLPYKRLTPGIYGGPVWSEVTSSRCSSTWWNFSRRDFQWFTNTPEESGVMPVSFISDVQAGSTINLSL